MRRRSLSVVYLNSPVMPSESELIGQAILEKTGRKPYVFVIMPFDSANYWLFHTIERAVKSFECACIHAGHLGAAGFDLRTKIQLAIERAELVIAEVSEKCKPNVFYELGYAAAKQKKLVVLKRHGAEIPTDIGGIEWVEYDQASDPDILEAKLREHLRWRLNSDVSLLQDLLLADDPRPAYIVAHPRYPSQDSPYQSRLYDERTYGDNLGVVGLLSAFGSIFGETNNVELISAQFAPRDLLQRNANVYLIGSTKVNPRVTDALKVLQTSDSIRWGFEPVINSPKSREWFRLSRTLNGKTSLFEGDSEEGAAGAHGLYKTDYGLILRAPQNPTSNRLIMVFAGAHSLGTGAACLAATRSPLIRKLKAKFKEELDFEIADKRRGCWVLVKGKNSEHDGMLNYQDVEVVECGLYPAPDPN
jgi:hypothetical protein